MVKIVVSITIGSCDNSNCSSLSGFWFKIWVWTKVPVFESERKREGLGLKRKQRERIVGERRREGGGKKRCSKFDLKDGWQNERKNNIIYSRGTNNLVERILVLHDK